MNDAAIYNMELLREAQIKLAFAEKENDELRALLRDIPAKIAADLFHNGNGEDATHLQQVVAGRYLGGWSMAGAISQIKKTIDDALENGEKS